MKELTIEDFKKSCNKKQCQRRTMITNNCSKEYKQEACFKKVITKLNKQQAEKQEIQIQKNKDWTDYMTKKEAGLIEPIEFEKDEKYEQFKKDCWMKYIGFYDGISVYKDWKDICMFWNCLTDKEKEFANDIDHKDMWLNKNLDIAHILGKGEKPELKFDLDNVVIIGRLWHSRIDKFKDPLTNMSISQQVRLYWFDRIKNCKN